MAGSIPYYQLYTSLDTPESKAFIEEALGSAAEFLGKPKIKVNRVCLRLSTPINTNDNLTRNFQLTELVDKNDGVFAIYLCYRPNDYSYFGQLAHEVAHLIDAQVFDAYIEGANTVFAERFLGRKGLDWKGWNQYFQNGNDPFYGTTYFMMKEVAAIVGDDGTKTLLLHAKWTDDNHTKKHIDINSWLRTLPSGKRQQATDAIKRHSAGVKKAIAETNHPSTFLLPQ